MRTHLRIAAGLFLLAGAILIFAAVAAPSTFDTFAASVRDSPQDGAELGATALGFTGRLLGILAAVFALPCLACGWGVLTRRKWSRLLGSALAAIAVVQVPVGTVIGAYLLWVLLSKRSEPWFEKTPDHPVD